MSVDTNAEKANDGGWRETVKVLIHALLLAMIVRVFFYQPFNIPSGSMKSTLLIGDYLFVSKLSYGYSNYSFPWSPNLFAGRFWGAEPKRGDVAVFKNPRDNATDYIKRVIGLPGDEIQVRHSVLYINGKEVPRQFLDEFSNVECGDTGRRFCRNIRYKRYEETLPNGVKFKVLDLETDGTYDNSGPFKVPAGHYFMMGDNRDNSEDSRSQRDGIGYVPLQNFIGRAEILFFSAAVDEPEALRLTSPWTWPFDIRWRRFFNFVR
jgi:signal peptidase I